MARISLIICDLCKEQMSDAEGGQYKVTLSFNKDLEGEICGKCHGALMARLLSDEKPKLTSKKAKKKPQLNATRSTTSATPDLYGPPEELSGPSEEDKAGREPTKELLEDEMTKVPSRFDKKIASKVVRAIKGSCPHHFKSYQDGKIVCGAAPDGFQGELASFKGCGNILTKAEY